MSIQPDWPTAETGGDLDGLNNAHIRQEVGVQGLFVASNPQESSKSCNDSQRNQTEMFFVPSPGLLH